MIRSQIESIVVKWEDITFHANERQRHLEEAVAKAFHRDVTSLQIWLDNTDKNVDAFIRNRPSEEQVEQFIKVRIHFVHNLEI